MFSRPASSQVFTVYFLCNEISETIHLWGIFCINCSLINLKNHTRSVPMNFLNGAKFLQRLDKYYTNGSTLNRCHTCHELENSHPADEPAKNWTSEWAPFPRIPWRQKVRDANASQTQHNSGITEAFGWPGSQQHHGNRNDCKGEFCESLIKVTCVPFLRPWKWTEWPHLVARKVVIWVLRPDLLKSGIALDISLFDYVAKWFFHNFSCNSEQRSTTAITSRV